MRRTALITGATNGIGLEFSRLFARSNINLILVARNQELLLSVADELSLHSIEVITYAKDLSVLDNAKAIYEDIRSRGITVDYLVNNAGFGVNDEYIHIDWTKEEEMFNLNMLTLAYFTKIFARDMVSRRFGRILNLGSVAAFQPGPYMAGYCATKAFVLSLSSAVNSELKGTNVSVSTLCPGVTDTKFHAVAQTENTRMSKSMSHATPLEVAEHGYKLMMKSKSMSVHGWSNKFIIFLNRFAPRSLVTTISGMTLKKNSIP